MLLFRGASDEICYFENVVMMKYVTFSNAAMLKYVMDEICYFSLAVMLKSATFPYAPVMRYDTV